VIRTLKIEFSRPNGPFTISIKRYRSGEFTEALTDNYLKLRLRGCHQPNRWLRARIENVVDGALNGNLAHLELTTT